MDVSSFKRSSGYRHGLFNYGTAYVNTAYVALPYTGMAYVVMVYTVVVYITVACRAVAYVVMACAGPRTGGCVDVPRAVVDVSPVARSELLAVVQRGGLVRRGRVSAHIGTQASEQG